MLMFNMSQPRHWGRWELVPSPPPPAFRFNLQALEIKSKLPFALQPMDGENRRPIAKQGKILLGNFLQNPTSFRK